MPDLRPGDFPLPSAFTRALIAPSPVMDSGGRSETVRPGPKFSAPGALHGDCAAIVRSGITARHDRPRHFDIPPARCPVAVAAGRWSIFHDAVAEAFVLS